MNYESASRTVKQSATAVASAHLALIVLNVSVMSSSLPNAYVSDPAANCGARYLVNVAAHNVLQAGLFAIAALVIALIFRLDLRKKTDLYGRWRGGKGVPRCNHLFTRDHFAFLLSFGRQSTRKARKPSSPAGKL